MNAARWAALDVAAKVRIRYIFSIFYFFFPPIFVLFLISLQLYKCFLLWFLYFREWFVICDLRAVEGEENCIRSFRSAVPWVCRFRSERFDVETLKSYSCLITQAIPWPTKSALSKKNVVITFWIDIMASRQAGFVLDAKSMGLNPSRPASSPPPPPSSASQMCRQVQPTGTSASHPHQESTLKASSPDRCTASTEAMSTEHYRCLIQKLRDTNGDAGDMSFELNSIFLKRLDEIDCLDEHEGDDMVRFVVNQGWYPLKLIPSKIPLEINYFIWPIFIPF